MQAVLVMFRSDGERRSFSVTRDMTVVGRREDCDLRIPLHEVSRKHARLVRDGDTLRLEDLGSSNGTFLNGQRVQEAVLNAGDSVQIGPVVFVLQVDGYPADHDLAPVAADQTGQAAPAPVAANMGPLSPTAQSELGDLGHLDPMPLEEDIGLTDLDPLPLEDDIGLGVSDHAPAKAEAKPPKMEPMPHEDEDVATLDHLEALPLEDDAVDAAHAELKPAAHDENDLDLDLLMEAADDAVLEHPPLEQSAAHAELEPASPEESVTAAHSEPVSIAEPAIHEHMEAAPPEECVTAAHSELVSIAEPAIHEHMEAAPPTEENVGDDDSTLLPMAEDADAMDMELSPEEDASLAHSEPVHVADESEAMDFELLPAEADTGLEMAPASAEEASPPPAPVEHPAVHVAHPAEEKVNGGKAAPPKSPVHSDLADLDDDFLELLDEAPKKARGNEPLNLDLDLDLDLDSPHQPHA